jgi:ParB-like chromosome segregation protein Spo0J
MNTSSSVPVIDRFAEISEELIENHPLNANVMSSQMFGKLKIHISKTGDYPPLIVRPIDSENKYQVIDGHNRLKIIRELVYESVRCYLWPCDDAQAMVLLATLNRLEGTDVPVLRAELIHELSTSIDLQGLDLLLPESRDEIEQLLNIEPVDEAALMESLRRAAAPALAGVSAISFAVNVDQAKIIEQAVAAASENLTGKNKRGRAIAVICEAFVEGLNA